MTREEEEIAVAFNDYRDALKLSTFGDFEYIDIQESFEEGAKWADNHPVNVWHDASKFPNKALPIIVEIDDDIEHSYEVISIDETDEKFWEYLVSDRDITMWAYISDLLPKQFGNSERLKGEHNGNND